MLSLGIIFFRTTPHDWETQEEVSPAFPSSLSLVLPGPSPENVPAVDEIQYCVRGAHLGPVAPTLPADSAGGKFLPLLLNGL